MKLRKKALMGILIAAPLLFAPKASHANILTDILNLLTGGNQNNNNQGQNNNNNCPPSQGNSVPVNGGVTILLVGGLALGGFAVYNQSRKNKVVTEAQ